MGLVSNLARSFSGGRGRGTRPSRGTAPRSGGGGIGRLVGQFMRRR